MYNKISQDISKLAASIKSFRPKYTATLSKTKLDPKAKEIDLILTKLRFTDIVNYYYLDWKSELLIETKLFPEEFVKQLLKELGASGIEQSFQRGFDYVVQLSLPYAHPLKGWSVVIKMIE